MIELKIGEVVLLVVVVQKVLVGVKGRNLE